jgi:hypothetical protein
MDACLEAGRQQPEAGFPVERINGPILLLIGRGRSRVALRENGMAHHAAAEKGRMHPCQPATRLEA